MKPVAVDYERPTTIEGAIRLLTSDAGAKVLAGGQTLGPMLNLRLVRPSLLVDITRIPDLVRVEPTRDAVTLGACITHAAIEDGRVDDFTNGFLGRVAAGIAYRAVRTRGTIGGSIAHADPAADWLTAFVALGAEVSVTGSKSRRRVAITDLVRGAMESSIEADELIDGIKLPRLSAAARTGYYKLCRKTGEFAEAIGAIVHDPERKLFRAVVGATAGRPIVIDDQKLVLEKPGDLGSFRKDWLQRHLQDNGYKGDAYELAVHSAALERAIRGARGQ